MPIRTLRIPIHAIDNSKKNEFYNDLRYSINIAKSTYNRVMTRCSALDSEAYDAFIRGEKIPKLPKLYAYPHESYNFPGCAGECSSISRDAESVYKNYRWELIRGRKSLPIRRSSPWPLLITTKNYKLCKKCKKKNYNKKECVCGESLQDINLTFEKRTGFDIIEKDDKLFAKIKLATKDGGSNWYEAELKNGSNYARLTNTIKKRLKDKPDCIRDSKIWIDKKNRAVVGISIDLPVREDKRQGTLLVKTSRECFLTCIKEKTTIPFSLNCDQVLRWQYERKRKQQRLRQDKKYGRKKYIDDKQRQVSQKYSDRLQTFCHEVSSQLIDYCNRNKIAKVELDTTVRSYIRDFPWFDLINKIKYKCEDNGIDFEETTLSIVPPDIDNEPHVYFLLAVDPITNKSLDKIKIGYTEQKKGKRQKDLSNMGGQDMVYIAAEYCAKSKLRKKEKEYHSYFSEYKISGEWFHSEPVIKWMREVDCFGNTGNLSQLSQVIEV